MSYRAGKSGLAAEAQRKVSDMHVCLVFCIMNSIVARLWGRSPLVVVTVWCDLSARFGSGPGTRGGGGAL